MDEAHNLPQALVRYESKEGLQAGSKHTPRLVVFTLHVESASAAMPRRPQCVSLASSGVQDIVRDDRTARVAR